jgi:hypothetical protein
VTTTVVLPQLGSMQTSNLWPSLLLLLLLLPL